MRIYSAGNLFTVYKEWIARQGEHFFLKLHGVDFARGREGIDITPVYIPAFTWIRATGQAALEIHFWRESSLTIFFFRYPPFVWATFSKAIHLEFKEDEE
jgi:hypothetical protein